MNNVIRALAQILAIAGLSASALHGCGVGEAKVASVVETTTARPLPVEVAASKKSDIYATYQATATISSDSEAPVLARVAGEIVEILVEEGDRVEKGQVLARLDGEKLLLQMMQAKANLDKAVKEYDRFVSLHERGLVSAAAYDGLRYEADALKATYELKRLEYSYTKIRAPISGVVSSREIKIGKHVNVNDPTFRITDTSKLVAYLKIPQAELAKFSAGHRASVAVDAMPGSLFAATIARISPTIDSRNGTFRATAYIDNTGGELAPGMFGRFDIAYEKHADALIIPAAALVLEDNESVVYVVQEGAAVRRAVETGIETDGMVEVLAGLAEGEEIVVTGHIGLRDGARVLASNNLTVNVGG